MAERILSGKIKQLVYTTEELSQSPLSTTVIDNGVLVYEKTSSGQIKCKMGDGNNVWSGLEYIEDSDKMDKIDPIGTGTLSMNRAKGSAIGTNSVALGSENIAQNNCSFAEGYNVSSSGYASHAEGYQSTSNRQASHAEGYKTTASGDNSHAEGGETTASGDNSHAEGIYSSATGFCSHAEGYKTTASGNQSHTEGTDTIANGKRSHAEGGYTIASSDYQHVQGKYNIEDTTNTYAHIVGGGTSNTDRKNIHTLDWNGNATFSGDITATDSEGNQVSLINDKMDKNNPTGTGSLSLNRLEGSIVGELSVALGSENIASGNGSYAEGLRNISGNYDRFSITSRDISKETIDNVNMICMNVTFSGETFPILVNDYIYLYTNSGIIKSSVQNIINTNTNSIFKIYVNENEILNSIINNVGVLSDISIIYTDNNSDDSICSHSEGYLTLSNGGFSHSEGYKTKASNIASHAEGYLTIANGMASHAEGVSTTAIDGSHSEGVFTKASSIYQHVQGKYNIEDTSGTYAHIVGGGTSDDNRKNIHTLDWNGNAVYSGDISSKTLSINRKEGSTIGKHSVALGENCVASGSYSHAEGYYNLSGGYTKFDAALGSETVDSTINYYIDVANLDTTLISTNDEIYVLVEDNTSTEKQICKIIVSSVTEYNTTGEISTVKHKIYFDENELRNQMSGFPNIEVINIYVKNNNNPYSTHAEGKYTTASGDSSHAEGNGTTASGNSSHAEGYGTTASGDYGSHAEGEYATASGQVSHAEGYYTTASGDSSHAEGDNTTASGENSHAEGRGTTASRYASHAEGGDTKAGGDYAHAEGYKTTASGYASHAEGEYTKASGKYAHAEGYHTTARTNNQHVQGKYNIEDTTSTYAHIVGGGTSNTDRKNIHTLDWNGNAVFSGDVTATKSDGTEVSLLSLKSTLDSIQVQNFYTGIEAPSNTLGEDGDLYLIT